MSIFNRKPKLPPIPRGTASTQEQDKTPQGGRVLMEVNGDLVWVDSSKTSGTTELSEEQKAEKLKQRESELMQMFGISEK